MSDNSQEHVTEVEHQSTNDTQETEADEYQSVSSEQHDLYSSDTRNSVLRGDSADNHLNGGLRNDVLDGSDGNDTLSGGDGDDTLIAGGQSDRGANFLDGGSGDDILVAGGAETLELHDFLQSHQSVMNAIQADAKFAGLLSLVDAASSSMDSIAASNAQNTATNIFALHNGNGNDAVYNFHAHGDKIQIDRGINGSDIADVESLLKHITVNGNDVTIDLGQGNAITLVGVDVAHLSADNVLWA